MIRPCLTQGMFLVALLWLSTPVTAQEESGELEDIIGSGGGAGGSFGRLDGEETELLLRPDLPTGFVRQLTVHLSRLHVSQEDVPAARFEQRCFEELADRLGRDREMLMHSSNIFSFQAIFESMFPAALGISVDEHAALAHLTRTLHSASHPQLLAVPITDPQLAKAIRTIAVQLR